MNSCTLTSSCWAMPLSSDQARLRRDDSPASLLLKALSPLSVGLSMRPDMLGGAV